MISILRQENKGAQISQGPYYCYHNGHTQTLQCSVEADDDMAEKEIYILTFKYLFYNINPQ